jgi:glucosylceramidase
MKSKLLAFSLLVAPGLALAQTQAEWITTTVTSPWRTQPALRATAATTRPADITVDLNQPAQTITGFGACFNELGWTSLSLLPAADRDKVFRELFAPGVGANFTICRMPVGANDFSRDWYSYDETPGDFAMQHFSIANDRETLIPFIKQAQQQYPACACGLRPGARLPG